MAPRACRRMSALGPANALPMLRNVPSDPSEPVVIRDFRYRHEADLAHAVLDAAGTARILHSSRAVRMTPNVPLTPSA